MPWKPRGRRKTPAREPESYALPNEVQRWFRGHTRLLSILSAVGFLLGLIALFPKKANDFYDEAVGLVERGTLVACEAKSWILRDAALSGTWTNAGCVDCEVPSHYVDLDIDVQWREVEGTISSLGLPTSKIWEYSLLRGNKNQGVVTAEVWDVVDGKQIHFAMLRFESVASNPNQILLKTLSQRGDFFPISTLMWRNASKKTIYESSCKPLEKETQRRKAAE